MPICGSPGSPKAMKRRQGSLPEKVLGRFRFDFLKQGPNGSKDAEAHLDDLQSRRPFRDFVYEFTAGRADCRWVSITRLPALRRGRRVPRLSRRRPQCDRPDSALRGGAGAVAARRIRSELGQGSDLRQGRGPPLRLRQRGFCSMFGKSPESMLGRHGGRFPARRQGRRVRAVRAAGARGRRAL